MTASVPQIEDTASPLFWQYETPEGALRLAYLSRDASAAGAGKPGIVWMGGFKSDMRSTKAARLDALAAATGRSCLRYDYAGHGESEGAFEDGTIGQWAAQSLAIVRALTSGPQIVVGSSMGGWIALLVARELAKLGESDRLAGLVLIAPAVDFTEALMWPQLSAAARRDIETKGFWLRPTPYAPDPYPITRALIEDGRRHLLFDGEIHANCPVHILQGMQDPDVPWRHALTLVEHLAGDPCTLTLIKDGDHRLSREEDIARLLAAVEAVA